MLRIMFILLCITACQSTNLTPTPTATEESRLIYPTLIALEPAEASPGETVKVSASGGYMQIGESGYDESARSFDLLFDEEIIGELSCYVNACFADISVPEDASMGEHTISTEGGSSLTVLVTAETR